MITTKIIETTVDLFNPADIYSASINDIIMKHLERRYVGRCFKAMLITKVLRIIKRSDVNMVCNRLDGAAQVDVQIEVEGHVFIPGEILHGCRVIEMRTNMIVAKHEFAEVQIAPGNSTFDSLLKIGIEIPVLIRNVRYTINSVSVSVVGQLFHYIYPASIKLVPKQPVVPEYFIASGTFDVEAQEKLAAIVQKITTFKESNEPSIKKGLAYIRCTKKPIDVHQHIACVTDIDSIAELPGQRIHTNMEMEGYIAKADDDKECIEYDIVRLAMSIANRLLIRMYDAHGFATHADKYPESYLTLLRESQV